LNLCGLRAAWGLYIRLKLVTTAQAVGKKGQGKKREAGVYGLAYSGS